MDNDSTEKVAALRARLVEKPLWTFALDLYARPGVEAACLTLQDEAGVDVCELLWRCWLAAHGLLAEDAPSSLDEIRRWQRDVTEPLRRLRRRLKPDAVRDPGVAELRRHLQAAELQAERLTLSRLERLTPLLPLSILPGGPSLAEKPLGRQLQLQKKSHLSALGTLVDVLDPSYPPR